MYGNKPKWFCTTSAVTCRSLAGGTDRAGQMFSYHVWVYRWPPQALLIHGRETTEMSLQWITFPKGAKHTTDC